MHASNRTFNKRWKNSKKIEAVQLPVTGFLQKKKQLQHSYKGWHGKKGYFIIPRVLSESITYFKRLLHVHSTPFFIEFMSWSIKEDVVAFHQMERSPARHGHEQLCTADTDARRPIPGGFQKDPPVLSFKTAKYK